MPEYGRGYAIVAMDLTGDMRDREVWEAAWDAMQKQVGRYIPEHRPQAYLTMNAEHVRILDQITRDIEILPHHTDPHPDSRADTDG